MDIYNYLKKDHKKVAGLFKKIISAKSAKIRAQLFLEIKMLLTLHADPETDTFYAALEIDKTGRKESKHGKNEHDEIKKALKKISKIPQKNIVKWSVELGKLMQIVEHHVEEEESEMFEEGRKIISDQQARELATQMEELKEKMRLSKKFENEFFKIL